MEETSLNKSQSLTHQNHPDYSVSKYSQSKKHTGNDADMHMKPKALMLHPIVKNLKWSVQNSYLWNTLEQHKYQIHYLKQKGNNSQNQCRKYGVYPPINQSPTSNAVAAETLARPQNVAEECGKKTISVTYDLPIAKKAMQIRSSEKCRYSNVSWFIPIGLEFFKMLGKYID